MKLHIALLSLAGVLASAQNLRGEHQNNMARGLAKTQTQPLVEAEALSRTLNTNNVISGAQTKKLNKSSSSVPFSFVDKVVEIYPGDQARRNDAECEQAVGIKYVSNTDPHLISTENLSGAIMPGVLQVEGLAQLCSICLETANTDSGKVLVFKGTDAITLNTQVVPGDVMVMEVKMSKKSKKSAPSFTGKVWVNGEVATKVKGITFEEEEFLMQ